MTPFLLKKIIGQLLMPFPFCLGVTFVGLFLLWFTKRQKTGKVLVTIGPVLLTLLSYGFVADALLGPFEAKHPTLAVQRSEVGSRRLEVRDQTSEVGGRLALSPSTVQSPPLRLAKRQI